MLGIKDTDHICIFLKWSFMWECLTCGLFLRTKGNIGELVDGHYCSSVLIWITYRSVEAVDVWCCSFVFKKTEITCLCWSRITYYGCVGWEVGMVYCWFCSFQGKNIVQFLVLTVGAQGEFNNHFTDSFLSFSSCLFIFLSDLPEAWSLSIFP